MSDAVLRRGFTDGQTGCPTKGGTAREPSLAEGRRAMRFISFGAFAAALAVAGCGGSDRDDGDPTPDSGGGSCNATNCAGCCFEGVCVAGTADSTCGTGGTACVACELGDTCNAGECSCEGCYEDIACLAGTSAAACGSGGVICEECGSDRICDSGACAIDPDSQWDIFVLDGEVETDPCDGMPWDGFGGAPDPRVEVEVGGMTYRSVGGLDSNTFTPEWNETVGDGVRASALNTEIVIRLHDIDTSVHDFMGACRRETPFPNEQFGGAAYSFVCGRDCNGDGNRGGHAGFTVRFELRPN